MPDGWRVLQGGAPHRRGHRSGGRAVRRDAGGTPELVTRSAAELASVHHKLHQLGNIPNTAWGVEAKTNQVSVEIFDGVFRRRAGQDREGGGSDRCLSRLGHMLRTSPLPQTVRVARNPAPAHRPAMRPSSRAAWPPGVSRAPQVTASGAHVANPLT
ncbi:alpha-lytic protease prodomain-containing protein [Streptomyces sp. NPDC058232]|uniref:alpha-lytic protease prodomain-containing protein n=1 Tax=unclassified Streptomyces TaxID=2593676 RepID=UPI0036CE6114